MSDKENQHKLLVDGHCIKLLNMAKKCRVSLRDVYMQLSKDVHGSSWSGPSVLVYADTLSQQEKCFIELVADSMNLIIKKCYDTNTKYMYNDDDVCDDDDDDSSVHLTVDDE